MSDRLEMIREEMRAEAAMRSDRLSEAMMISCTKRVPNGRTAAAYGETACPRCGVRSGIGCKHRPAGDTSTKLTSHQARRGRP